MFRSRPYSTSFRQLRDERGISIIEVAIVMLIIAIVAAIVVPQVVAYMRMYKVGVAARNVATALQRARYIATSNNSRAGILVAELRRVEIEQYDPEGKADPEKKGAVLLPEGTQFSSDAPKQIAFDGRGVITPMPKESPTLRINGANGYYAIVTISPTGQVTVTEAKQEEDA